MSTSISAAALLVLLLGGPLHHVTVHGRDDAIAHNSHHESGCQDDPNHSPTENSPTHHSSHTCPVCVLLSIGCTEPVSAAVVLEHRPALTTVVCSDSINLPTADQQLPGARAPPATASS